MDTDHPERDDAREEQTVNQDAEHDTPQDAPRQDDAGHDDAGHDAPQDDAGQDAAESREATGRPAERRETFDSAGPAELDLTIGAGRVSVALAEGTEVTVSVRADASAGRGWTQSLSDLIGWLSEATGADLAGADLAQKAVDGVEITWSEIGRRLVVRPPTELPLKSVPLILVVTAPTGSRVDVNSGSAAVTVTGSAGNVGVRTGSGEVDVEAVDGDVEVSTGSGGVSIGPVTGRSRLRAGSGRISVDSVGGPSEVKAGSAEVRLGAVHADLSARTGSGDLTVADAHGGRLDLNSGSGGLRVGVHAGVGVELDLSSGTGRAHSELPVASAPPDKRPTLVIRGRSGTGDVLVSPAAR
ncbi:MAG: hypothetical protein JWR88_1512 [Pseudonocardia sp.]|nr:hypothetical protein [Pseudonocardia sp.]